MSSVVEELKHECPQVCYCAGRAECHICGRPVRDWELEQSDE